MLMEEQPRDLRRYLALVYDRRAPDHRLTDVCQEFGADLARFDARHHQISSSCSRTSNAPSAEL